jgi:hypothetical protein
MRPRAKLQQTAGRLRHALYGRRHVPRSSCPACPGHLSRHVRVAMARTSRIVPPAGNADPTGRGGTPRLSPCDSSQGLGEWRLTLQRAVRAPSGNVRARSSFRNL